MYSYLFKEIGAALFTKQLMLDPALMLVIAEYHQNIIL